MSREQFTIRFAHLIACLIFSVAPMQAWAEFTLNFQPNPNVVNSIANATCDGAGGGMGGMGGMGMFGPGCGSDFFRQEVVEDNGNLYYHVILGDPNQDDFAMEFYIRAAGCCWWAMGGGMGGMGGMGGGDAPYSASYGDTNDRLASAWLPLAGPEISGSGTGNPNRVYMRQINNDSEMNQEFLKNLEGNKPRITQTVTDGELVSTFDLDMRNGGHASFTNPSGFTNQTIVAGAGSFDMNIDAPNAQPNAGNYSYSPGPGFGQSYGTYSYQDGGYDVYATDWLAYCQPNQNPDHSCNFNGGGGGMMDGGMGM